MIRLLIVARHPGVREGLTMVLRLAGGFQILGAAPDPDAAMRVAAEGCPDVLLVDLEMPEGMGYETLRQFARLC